MRENIVYSPCGPITTIFGDADGCFGGSFGVNNLQIDPSNIILTFEGKEYEADFINGAKPLSDYLITRSGSVYDFESRDNCKLKFKINKG